MREEKGGPPVAASGLAGARRSFLPEAHRQRPDLERALSCASRRKLALVGTRPSFRGAELQEGSPTARSRAGKQGRAGEQSREETKPLRHLWPIMHPGLPQAAVVQPHADPD